MNCSEITRPIETDTYIYQVPELIQLNIEY